MEKFSDKFITLLNEVYEEEKNNLILKETEKINLEKEKFNTRE